MVRVGFIKKMIFEWKFDRDEEISYIDIGGFWGGSVFGVFKKY